MEINRQAKKILANWILLVICVELFLKYQCSISNQLNRKVIPPKQNISVMVLELIYSSATGLFLEEASLQSDKTITKASAIMAIIIELSI